MSWGCVGSAVLASVHDIIAVVTQAGVLLQA